MSTYNMFQPWNKQCIMTVYSGNLHPIVGGVLDKLDYSIIQRSDYIQLSVISSQHNSCTSWKTNV